MEQLRADLVCEGGGVKGIGLVGAVSAVAPRLFASGQQAARAFLAGWDLDAHVRRCRARVPA